MAARRYGRRLAAREALMISVAALYCVPLYFLVTMPFKSEDELFLSPFALPERLDLANFVVAWTEGGRAGLGAAMLNSFVITGGSVLALVLIGAAGAYAIARKGGAMGAAVYYLFLLGFLLPLQLAVIPLYSVFDRLGLVGSIGGMILLYTGLLMPMSVFLYTGFLRGLPKDYEEAARIDGAREMRIFLRVVFPLMAPVTGTVAILAGLVIWNDFFVSLIFLGGSQRETLPVAVYSFVGEYASQWNVVFAGVLISIAPILLFYLFAQKQLIKGFSGGVKG